MHSQNFQFVQIFNLQAYHTFYLGAPVLPPCNKNECSTRSFFIGSFLSSNIPLYFYSVFINTSDTAKKTFCFFPKLLRLLPLSQEQ